MREAFCDFANNLLGGLAGEQACMVATSFLVTCLTIIGIVVIWKSLGYGNSGNSAQGAPGSRSPSRTRSTTRARRRRRKYPRSRNR